MNPPQPYLPGTHWVTGTVRISRLTCHPPNLPATDLPRRTSLSWDVSQTYPAQHANENISEAQLCTGQVAMPFRLANHSRGLCRLRPPGHAPPSARSLETRIGTSPTLVFPKLTRHRIKCRERAQVLRLYKPPSTPRTSLSRLMGDCKSTNLGRDRLRSVDRNNKTTLLLTRRCGTNKSYAKDLSPRMVKLQDVS